ncbi:MAG: GNAT family N-acetyltransferase [Pseudomonadota bacterium]
MTPKELARIHMLAMTVPAPWSVWDFEDILATSGAFCASEGDFGFAIGRVVLDEAELLTLAVDPARQRQGLGRVCLDLFEQRASDAGAFQLHLEVAATNLAALSLYKSNGWQVSGHRKAYYAGATPRIDAVLMTKQFARA